ncbi:hypothetical protein HGM15179_003778 [Zosterops borbonicus]|uniref:Uncharacterized protein n=1 Tax=Zosterops borbonicus TaxID=364589 RepID=A0A8K1GQG9_9PASS|nr:hypothetical protein HGM15179_003778 [Zosterops borbonicus]
MYAITLICEEGCQWKPKTRTSAFLTSVPRCSQPGTTRKSSLTYQMGLGMARAVACLRSRKEPRPPPCRESRQEFNSQAKGPEPFHTCMDCPSFRMKKRLLAAGNETVIGIEIRLRPQVKWSWSTMSATYRWAF